jgi:predicted nucleotidyltransferase component of viral defense system
MLLPPAQTKILAKKFKIHEKVVLREYIQLVFLKELYDEGYSENIFFKGGTAIRLVLNGTRFSEDLDFTVVGSKDEFRLFITKFFQKMEKLYGFTFKDKKETQGISFLLTSRQGEGNNAIFVKLDFSFREKVFTPTQTILDTEYPVMFNSYINHLSPEEIVSEKIRALMTRSKGRDIYDLWFLLNQNIIIPHKLVLEKLKYYEIKEFDYSQLISRIKKFDKNKFVSDLQVFVSADQRVKLASLFDYAIAYLEKKITTLVGS